MNRPTPRHADILKLVHERGTVRVEEIASRLGVSQETVRRDIRPLALAGEVVKLHGAIALPHDVGEAPFERRLRENAEAKRAIARHAARHISDGDSLMLDTGTTTSIFARELLRKRNLTVVTNSSDVARTLSTVNGNQVYMAGGELNGDNGAAFGVSAVRFVASFNVRHTFISISAMDALAGPTDSSLDEAEFARMLLARGERRYILTDSSKFGRRALIKVCEFGEFETLVTERAPPPDLAAALAATGVAVDVA
ncbi:MAG TPA: DeoR/GlpR family DNA-binding transcription regulator [Aestuariivirga sp.]|nr:DeoR/GlpR transcriptional regulator [Alphaproteobacteria bacterium]HRX36065.1 DeoR/GlpR family DNA-binding transcription regulator [Aestuariivirga sp.]